MREDCTAKSREWRISASEAEKQKILFRGPKGTDRILTLSSQAERSEIVVERFVIPEVILKLCPHCGKELPKAARAIKYTILFNYDTARFEGINGEVDIWKEKYPAIDVSAEIKKAEGWAYNNPKNRKSNWKTFLGKWMARAQDKAPTFKSNSFAEDDMRSPKSQLLSQLKDRSCKGMKANYLSNEAVQLFYSLKQHWDVLQRRVQNGEDIFSDLPVDRKLISSGERE